MHIRHMVRKTFEVIGPDKGVASIEEQLLENSFLVVLDEGAFLGLLTLADIVESPHKLVIDCLRHKPHVDSEQEIESVLKLSKESRNSVLPVFKGDEFIGVVTQGDIMDYLLEYRNDLEKELGERTAELFRVNALLRTEITERKRMEERLKTASNEWRITFDSTTDLIMLLDSEMKIIKANLATAKFFSNPIKEILDKNFSQLFRVNGIPLNVYPFERMNQAKKREEAELYLPERNIWIKISVDSILDDKGNIIRYVYIIRDITGRKQAEEELRAYQGRLQSLASQLSLVEERERHRIATDLHDHIGQTLALCQIKLGALRESASPTLAASVDGIRDLIEQTIHYTRSLTFELSPPILYDLGFEAAVEWLGEEILKEHGILFHYKNDEQPKPLNDEARVLLFQAVRELLVNIAKHAQAREAKVSIQKVGDDIRINIEDDGIGFDTYKIDFYLRSGCFGLFSIRERLNRMGGYLGIESEPGKGTRIYIIAPLSPKSKNGRVI